MGKKRTYTDEQFIDAVKTSFSLAETLSKLSLSPTGGNYIVAKRRIISLGVDNSHFTGMGHLKGKHHNWAHKTPTNKILVENSMHGGSTSSLRERLIKENYFERKCYNCKNTEWIGKLIPLELEHINGNKFDNRIENLTLLCPNCHALTSTYRGKNKPHDPNGKYVRQLALRKERIEKDSAEKDKLVSGKFLVREQEKCSVCNVDIHKSKSGLCAKCYKKTIRKVERPTLDILLMETEQSSFVAVGKKYGVSDNAIRKWIKSAQKEINEDIITKDTIIDNKTEISNKENAFISYFSQ